MKQTSIILLALFIQAGCQSEVPTNSKGSNEPTEARADNRQSKTEPTEEVDTGGSPSDKPRTIETFLPYLTGKHDIIDLSMAIPLDLSKGDWFNSGAAFIWNIYRLDDGSYLQVGEHVKASADHYDKDHQLIKSYLFKPVMHRRFP